MGGALPAGAAACIPLRRPAPDARLWTDTLMGRRRVEVPPLVEYLVDDVVQRMKPAHVTVTYTGTPMTGFLTDDSNSLTDNTVLAT